MGLVKTCDALLPYLRIASAAMSRSIDAQAQRWIRVGRLAELHPEAMHPELMRPLLSQEQVTLKELLQ
ncbi:hypothetical protein IAE35_07245 [Pseudomonas sp. S75]|uniref:TA system antitoxin ParD family protein n=1 Tax=unclassified Pseudomonas TaxID=196821 RepID=UPI0019033AC0|nr:MULTISPECIES: hypothetical protein [unclassified Pseudomonas]MBJ9975580.1 hypothetical protein [Pseudomonas sp. S30]MBK0153131.1 hypothetical protein [Pseudomonas sp. S75]